MVVFTLLALAAAAVVLVVASVADHEPDDAAPGVRGYLTDVRSGLRTMRSDRPRRGATGGAIRQRPDRGADRGASDLDDFFDATAVQAPAYVAVEDLTETLARARERAARGVSGFTRR